MALDAIINRKEHSWWQQFLEAPYVTLAKTLYAQRQRIATKTLSHDAGSDVTVVCVSDTHNSQPDLPPGDVLIHAGDMTQSGTAEEVQSQLDWLNAQPHTYKVIIAGNHDIVLDDEKAAEFGISPLARHSLRWGSIVYLERAAVDLKFSSGRSLSVFGNPSTRRHGNWAFQYDKGTDVFSNQVRDPIDILITHSAPRFHLDVAGWGDEFLLRELWRVKPRLHVFGHIHGGYGRDILLYDRFEHIYERASAGSAGLWALLQMALLLLQMMASGLDRSAKKTTLVNASVVGGLLDRQVRKVQVVQL